MKDKIRYNKLFKYILFLLFIIFMVIYISNDLGYYEYQKAKQVAMTDEQILNFEQDIKDGKDVTLEDYVVVPNNYQNKVSKIGLDISNLISKTVKESIENVFNGVGKLIN